MAEADRGSTRVLDWLREQCADYRFDVVAVYKRTGEHDWPLHAGDEAELEETLAQGGHLLPLPKEPAALANVIEVSIVDFILDRAEQLDRAEILRGTERGYPDIELSGSAFGGAFHAVDVKVARRGTSRRQTQSRITLYTGNTYFRYPQLRWPGTFRPFQDYASHLDVICVYTLNVEQRTRVEDLEVIVHPAWRIGSRQRSSTTREYIGAVQSIEALRNGQGEFATEEEFYSYWRRHPFRIGRAVQQQLDRLLNGQGGATS